MTNYFLSVTIPSGDGRRAQKLAPHRSEEATRVAAIVSVVETCRRNQFPVRDYLNAILPGLADLPVNWRR